MDLTDRNRDFNADWTFWLGDAADAMQRSFDDAEWRTLDVPHDWSVEASFSEELEGATGYFCRVDKKALQRKPSKGQIIKPLI